MGSFLAVVRDLALLVVRLGLGGIMLVHGWDRWQSAGGVQRQIESFTELGMPYPNVVGWGTVIVELVGGVFLIVGALTPLVALLVVVEQALLIGYVSLPHGVRLLNPAGAYNGGYEYNVLVALLGLLLLVFGAGRLAMDRLFRRGREGDESYANSPSRVGAAV